MDAHRFARRLKKRSLLSLVLAGCSKITSNPRERARRISLRPRRTMSFSRSKKRSCFASNPLAGPHGYPLTRTLCLRAGEKDRHGIAIARKPLPGLRARARISEASPSRTWSTVTSSVVPALSRSTRRSRTPRCAARWAMSPSPGAPENSTHPSSSPDSTPNSAAGAVPACTEVDCGACGDSGVEGESEGCGVACRRQ